MNQDRIQYLDSLRGLAALSVVWSHYMQAYGAYFPFSERFWNTPLHIFFDGFAAISFFFVLSGLVLSRKYFADQALFSEAKFSLIGFYCARTVRIVGPFCIALLLSLIAKEYVFSDQVILSEQSEWVKTFWRYEVSGLRFFSEAVLFFPPQRLRLIPQDWTLHIELVMSFLIPFLIFLAFRNSSWLIVLTALCLVYFDSPFLLHFSLGVLLSRHFNFIKEKVMQQPKTIKLAVLCVGILLYSWGYSIRPYMLEYTIFKKHFIFSGIGSSIIISIFIGSTSLKRIVSNRPMLYLGKISYSMYLTHFIVLLCFIPNLFLTMMKYKQFASSHLVMIGFFGIALAAIVFSSFFYHFFEHGFVNLSRRINRIFIK